jgi:hypothetical protein
MPGDFLPALSPWRTRCKEAGMMKLARGGRIIIGRNSCFLTAFFSSTIPLILLFETVIKLKLFFECGIPTPQDVGHLRLRYCNFFNPFFNLNCSA